LFYTSRRVAASSLIREVDTAWLSTYLTFYPRLKTVSTVATIPYALREIMLWVLENDAAV
jgi:hypothetical protein